MATGSKRFAPLMGSLKSSPSQQVPELKGVVFDMDGTLWYVES